MKVIGGEGGACGMLLFELSMARRGQGAVWGGSRFGLVAQPKSN